MRTRALQVSLCPGGSHPGHSSRATPGAHRTVLPDLLLWVLIQTPRGRTAEAVCPPRKALSLGWRGGWPSGVVSSGVVALGGGGRGPT